MSLSIGVVGLPNVGKSTLFKALTKKQIDIANYPFCTIEPNKGIVAVPDKRLEKLAELFHSAKIVPAKVEFVDIAGLVKGAHKGEGLGNQFLSHIREVNAICHVIRNFHSGDITHVSGKIDPKEDAEIINMELAYADLEKVEKQLLKIEKDLRGASREEKKELNNILEIFENKIRPALSDGKLLSKIGLSEEEKTLIKRFDFLTIKPIIYILNIDEDHIGKEQEFLKGSDEIVIPICAKLEAELADLSDEETREYLKESGLPMTGLDRIILESYKILNLISFLTTGPDETRAWDILKGTKAPQAAGTIHTDFERGFIKADVIFWEKLFEAGSWENTKEKGLVRTEGKDYEIQDGDVCDFKFNV